MIKSFLVINRLTLKYLWLACFVFSSSLSAEFECPWELLLPDTTAELRTEIGQSLWKLGTDPQAILGFVRKFGRGSHFSFPPKIDGQYPTTVAIPVTEQNID